MKKIALIAHSNTGIVALRRVKNLLIDKIDDVEFILFVPYFLNETYINELFPEVKNLKIERIGISNKIRILQKFLKKNSKLDRKDLGINNEKYLEDNDIDEKDLIKFEPQKAFNIQNIFKILIKLILRIIVYYFLNKKFKSYDFKIAIFSSDRTNIITNYIYSICRKKNIKSVLAEFTHIAPKEFFVSERSLSRTCYVEIKGLFARLFPDQIICKNSTTGIAMYSITDTVSMFLTGVLPRDPLNIIGSLHPDKIICSSDFLYKKCLNSPFLNNQSVKKSISVR